MKGTFILATVLMGQASIDCAGSEWVPPAIDLNETAGKVFDADLATKRFRFLKQDVQYDPQNGQGSPWHTVRWTEQTVFRKFAARQNLSGIGGPVVAVFSGLDEQNAEAFKKGEPFQADKLLLRPDLNDPSLITATEGDVIGWFTPREAKFSRDGTLKLGGKELHAGAKRGDTRIFIEEELAAEDLAKGCWRATLTGRYEDAVFTASRILLEPLVDPLTVDDPNLPRVLSVGDSISMNYEPHARAALHGVANYHRIEDNCWSTHRGVAFMAYWLGDYTRKGLGWDVILFNSGMHDMKQTVLHGAYAVPLDVYKTNLRKEIEIMMKTGASLVFVTTTPVPNDCGSAQYAFRSKGAEEDFNRAAREVLKDFPMIRICDLAKFVNESNVYDNWRKGKEVHYWKEEEQKPLGKVVAEAVVEALDEKKK